MFVIIRSFVCEIKSCNNLYWKSTIGLYLRIWTYYQNNDKIHFSIRFSIDLSITRTPPPPPRPTTRSDTSASGSNALGGAVSHSVHKLSLGQGRLWIVHHQNACCRRCCKLWSKDGRGSTVSDEVKSLFRISACAASGVRICMKICKKFDFWLCEPTLLRLK